MSTQTQWQQLFYATAAAVAIVATGYVRYESLNRSRAQFQQVGADDAIDQYAERMQPLKLDLPSDVSALSYLQPEEPGQPVPGSEAWTMAQYVMAPVLVHREQRHDFVLGDCQSPTQEMTLFSMPGVSVVRRYPRGVLLLVRDEQPGAATSTQGAR